MWLTTWVCQHSPPRECTATLINLLALLNLSVMLLNPFLSGDKNLDTATQWRPPLASAWALWHHKDNKNEWQDNSKEARKPTDTWWLTYLTWKRILDQQWWKKSRSNQISTENQHHPPHKDSGILDTSTSVSGDNGRALKVSTGSNTT